MVPTHLTIVQGTPFRFLVRVTHRNEDGDLVPRPLTDCVVRLQARSHITASDTLLDLSSEGSSITLDEAAGTFLIELNSKETRDLVWGRPHTVIRAVYQCEIEFPDEDTLRVLSGTITLSPEVVR